MTMLPFLFEFAGWNDTAFTGKDVHSDLNENNILHIPSLEMTVAPWIQCSMFSLLLTGKELKECGVRKSNVQVQCDVIVWESPCLQLTWWITQHCQNSSLWSLFLKGSIFRQPYIPFLNTHQVKSKRKTFILLCVHSP